MLSRAIKRFVGSAGRSEERRELAERILKRLEEWGTLEVDAEFLKEMRVGKTQVLFTLCELLLAERLHLLSDSLGKTIIMSNRKFVRSLLYLTDVRLRNERRVRKPRALAEPAPPVAVVEPEVRVVKVEDIEAEADSEAFVAEHKQETAQGAAIFTEIPPPRESEDDWFAIEVAPDLPDGVEEGINLPVERQSLPDRKREPWIVFDEIIEEETKN